MKITLFLTILLLSLNAKGQSSFDSAPLCEDDISHEFKKDVAFGEIAMATATGNFNYIRSAEGILTQIVQYGALYLSGCVSCNYEKPKKGPSLLAALALLNEEGEKLSTNYRSGNSMIEQLQSWPYCADVNFYNGTTYVAGTYELLRNGVVECDSIEFQTTKVRLGHRAINNCTGRDIIYWPTTIVGGRFAIVSIESPGKIRSIFTQGEKNTYSFTDGNGDQYVLQPSTGAVPPGPPGGLGSGLALIWIHPDDITCCHKSSIPVLDDRVAYAFHSSSRDKVKPGGIILKEGFLNRSDLIDWACNRTVYPNHWAGNTALIEGYKVTGLPCDPNY